jgi:hypothetical protein
VIGAAGAVYAVWRQTLGQTLLFSLVFALSFAVMLLAVVVAFRVRPLEGPAPASREASKSPATGQN